LTLTGVTAIIGIIPNHRGANIEQKNCQTGVKVHLVTQFD